jgi:hypothetical protein
MYLIIIHKYISVRKLWFEGEVTATEDCISYFDDCTEFTTNNIADTF